MTIRASVLAILCGLLAAIALFTWSGYRAASVARAPGGTAITTPSITIALPIVPAATSVSAAPTFKPAASPQLRAPTEVPVPSGLPTTATSVSAPASRPTVTPDRQVSLTLDDLDAELKRSLSVGGAPLRNPRVKLLPPDRVGLTAGVPVSIFEVPVELEARLSVDDRGTVRVNTTRVDAIGATLPAAITSELGRRVDDEGSRAIGGALPPGSVARRVVVEPRVVRVELAG